MVFFLLSEIQSAVTKTCIGEIILERRIDILFAFNVVALRFSNKKRILQVSKV